MKLPLQRPIRYMITAGTLTDRSFAAELPALLNSVQNAVRRGVSLVQLREKNLSARYVYTAAREVLGAVSGTGARVLVNDRADIAAAAGAGGVHLTARSLSARSVRDIFGPDLLIGVSTHSSAEVSAAASGGANFAVFGPVFDTPGKGPAVRLEELERVCAQVYPFPILALGGVSEANFDQVIAAGAQGAAGIRWFADNTEDKLPQ